MELLLLLLGMFGGSKKSGGRNAEIGVLTTKRQNAKTTICIRRSATPYRPALPLTYRNSISTRLRCGMSAMLIISCMSFTMTVTLSKLTPR